MNMKKNEADFIELIKHVKQAPPSGAMERCISSLPDVEKKVSLLPLLKLQLKSLPAIVYILVVFAIGFQFGLFINISSLSALTISSVINAFIALVLLWHLLLSGIGGMTEIEKACKYSYSQILLARIVCLCIFAFAIQTITILPNAFLYHISPTQVLASTIPTLLGALGTLCCINYINNTDTTIITIYLVNTMVSSIFLEKIIEIGFALTAAIFLLIIFALIFQTKNLMNRSIQYETYNY